MMQVYRLAREKYSHSLSGKGAALKGQRWNSKGTEIIYTSESRALAFAEVCTYVSLKNFPKDFCLLEIVIPDSIKIQTVKIKNLPNNWNTFPHQYSTQNVGDSFVESGKFAVIKVPSVVIPGDSNYLINPRHKGFESIKIKAKHPFPVDPRLFS